MRRRAIQKTAYSADLMTGVGLILLATLVLVLYFMLALHHDCRNFLYQPGSLTGTVCDLMGYNYVPRALVWIR